MKIAVIGLGLMGGSIALDLKKRKFASETIGVDYNIRHANIAKKLGLVDRISSLRQGICESDMIILAIPVDGCLELLPRIMDLIDKQVVTDLCSTKLQLIKSVENHPKRKYYIPAHPMTGTEFSGPTAAHSGLFDNKCSIICNGESRNPGALNCVVSMFQCLNMRCVYMDAEVHDRQTAYVSHLSHISAFALSLTVLNKEKKDKHIFELAGGGFDSTVRLAKSSADMWAPIFHQNRENVSKALQKYIDWLQIFKNRIDEDDLTAIKELIIQSNDIKRILDQDIKPSRNHLKQSRNP